MAEQAASTVVSAVIGEVTDRALTVVMRKLWSRSRPVAAHEKLQRLETLVLKLRSAVEVSEKHAIGSASLLEWRDRLREAATESGAVVLDFQRKAAKEEGERASTSVPGQQQPTGASALYFTRSALGGMAQRVRDATRRLFSADEDVQKLDSALEKMERLTPDIRQFLTTLQLDASPERGQRPAKRRRVQRKEILEGACYAEALPKRKTAAESATAIVQLASAAEGREDRETEARMLARELERTLLCTERYYMNKTEDRDMEGLECLTEWVAVVREAKESVNAVLQTLRPGSNVIHKAGGDALDLAEDGKLYSFARAVQLLVRHDPWCFTVLVNLCPRKQ